MDFCVATDTPVTRMQWIPQIHLWCDTCWFYWFPKLYTYCNTELKSNYFSYNWYPCSGVWWCLPWVSQPGTTDTHVLDTGDVMSTLGFPASDHWYPCSGHWWCDVYPGFPSLGPLIPMFWTLVVSTLGFPAWDHWYPCSGLWWCLPWVSQHLTSMLHRLHTMNSSDSPLVRHLPTYWRLA